MITGSSDFRILQAMLDRDFCNCRRAIKIDGIVEGPHHLILRLLPNHLTFPCMCGLVCVRQRLTYCTIHLVGCGTHSHIIFKWLRIDNPPAVLRFSPVRDRFSPRRDRFPPHYDKYQIANLNPRLHGIIAPQSLSIAILAQLQYQVNPTNFKYKSFGK